MLWMNALQTPGNIINIVFQILYNSPISTWITYVICLVQQSIILGLMIYFHCKNKKYEEI